MVHAPGWVLMGRAHDRPVLEGTTTMSVKAHTVQVQTV